MITAQIAPKHSPRRHRIQLRWSGRRREQHPTLGLRVYHESACGRYRVERFTATNSPWYSVRRRELEDGSEMWVRVGSQTHRSRQRAMIVCQADVQTLGQDDG